MFFIWVMIGLADRMTDDKNPIQNLHKLKETTHNFHLYEMSWIGKSIVLN